jgi:hypothetical protein
MTSAAHLTAKRSILPNCENQPSTQYDMIVYSAVFCNGAYNVPSEMIQATKIQTTSSI